MPFVRFYRMCKDGRPMTIALSEEAGWRSLETYWAYEPAERDRWSAREVERVVPAVDGVLHFWGGDGVSLPHVHWTCPACGEEHHTDLGPGEPNPTLWSCERGGDSNVFLVSWHREGDAPPTAPAGRAGTEGRATSTTNPALDYGRPRLRRVGPTPPLAGTVIGFLVGTAALAVWVVTFQPHGGVELSAVLFPIARAVLQWLYPQESIRPLLWYGSALGQWVLIGVVADVVRAIRRRRRRRGTDGTIRP